MPVPSRLVETRLIVIVVVDVTKDSLLEALAAPGGGSLSEVVAAEVISNLESVEYVESVTVAEL